MKRTIKVDLIDDDDAVLDSLGIYLERRGFVVNRFASGGDYVRSRPASPPNDCIVSDVRMNGMSGMDLQRWLTRSKYPVPLILITGFSDIGVAVAAMKSGAHDFFEKPVDERQLVASIRQAASRWEERIAAQSELHALLERYDTLSERERQVMRLATQGCTSRMIAAQLGISPRTVEIHRAAVLEKTRSTSLADLIRLEIAIEQLQERPVRGDG